MLLNALNVHAVEILVDNVLFSLLSVNIHKCDALNFQSRTLYVHIHSTHPTSISPHLSKSVFSIYVVQCIMNISHYKPHRNCTQSLKCIFFFVPVCYTQRLQMWYVGRIMVEHMAVDMMSVCDYTTLCSLWIMERVEN